MERPKLTKDEALQVIKDHKFHVPESVMVLAVRGYYKNSMGKPGENDRGIYDDAMFLIGPNFFRTFNANTDPSKYKPGIAKLIPGLHYFKKGKHGISRPGGGYPAFRPATPDESLPVTRDGSNTIVKAVAINLHSGGIHNTGSEGCQTVIADQWKEFQQTAYHLLDLEAQKYLPYILIEL